MQAVLCCRISAAVVQKSDGNSVCVALFSVTGQHQKHGQMRLTYFYKTTYINVLTENSSDLYS